MWSIFTPKRATVNALCLIVELGYFAPHIDPYDNRQNQRNQLKPGVMHKKMRDCRNKVFAFFRHLLS